MQVFNLTFWRNYLGKNNAKILNYDLKTHGPIPEQM